MVIRMKYVNEKLISEEINKLVPVFGKENAARINRAFLLGDEKTRERISELVDVMKAAVFNDKSLSGSVLEVDGSIAIGPPGPETSLISRRSELLAIRRRRQDLSARIERLDAERRRTVDALAALDGSGVAVAIGIEHRHQHVSRIAQVKQDPGAVDLWNGHIDTNRSDAATGMHEPFLRVRNQFPHRARRLVFVV